MKQLLINETAATIYLDETHIYNTTTVFDEIPKQPTMKHPFETTY